MKIFKLFGKVATRHVRKTPAVVTQPDAQAIITSKKIDAIECEMSAEFSTGLPVPALSTETSTAVVDIRQTLEEAAILYSSGQAAVAQQLLSTATHRSDARPDNQLAWRMLLELHESAGDQPAFEQCALAYARRFETSPPPWQRDDRFPTDASNDKLPVLSFRGRLSAGSRPVLEQLFQLGCRHRRFCLEFTSLSEVDLPGCRALLETFGAWRQQGCEISLQRDDALRDRVRALIQIGRRDDDDAGWRLLMELLWLMQVTDAYEAVCIDYSMTYEISPPLPCSLRAAPSGMQPELPEPVFIMPDIIRMPAEALLARIGHYAQTHERIVLDCARLRQVDFNAAAPLMTGLRRLAESKPVELRHTRFLVSVLLQLVGGNDTLKIFNRKT